MAKSVSRKINLYINGNEVEGSIKDIKKEYYKLRREIEGTALSQEEYNAKAAEISRLDGILSNHRKNLRSTHKSTNMMTAGMGKLVGVMGAAFATEQIIQFGKELFNTATVLDQLDRKASIVFGETLAGVSAQAERNANAMGLTNSQYIEAAANIADLLIPMKFQRQEAADISTNLVDLSGALSEWTNGQKSAKEVTEILGKAMLGEREQLKTLGISILESDVKARLMEKGLDKLTGTMLQQAKATATLELITEKSVDAQTAYDENTGNMVRSSAELTAKFQSIKEEMATALIPVFTRLLEVASSGIETFNLLSSALEGIFSPSSAAVKEFDKQNQKVTDLASTMPNLIDRYDELSRKTELTKEEQKELGDVIKKIGDKAPETISRFDDYGNAVDISKESVEELIAAEKERLQYLNSEGIAELEKSIKKAEENRQYYLSYVSEDKVSWDEWFGLADGSDYQKKAAEYAKDIAQMRKDLARLQGGDVEDQVARQRENEEKKKAAQEEEAKKAASESEKERQKKAKKAAEDAIREREKEIQTIQKLADSYFDFQQSIADFQADEARNQSLSGMSEDDRELAELAQKYDEKIALTKEKQSELQATILQAQNAGLEREAEALQQQYEMISQQEIELENQKWERMQELKDEQKQREAEREIERRAEYDEVLAENEAEKMEAQREAEILLMDEADAKLARDLDAIDLFYEELLMRSGLGEDQIIALIKKKNAEKEAVREASSKRQFDQELSMFSELYGELGNVLIGFSQLMSDEESEAAEFKKAIGLVQIAFDTGMAIAGVVKIATQSSVTPIDMAISIAAGIGTVVANIAKAKKLMSEDVPQRYMGGYYDVRGQSDGRPYRAKNIGRQSTGMLPGSPSLVLASEHGPEYFVSNDALRNPLVAQYVSMIDAIQNGGIPQYAEGGSTSDSDVGISGGTSSADNMMNVLVEIRNLMSVMVAQDRTIAIGDEQIAELSRREQELNRVSGGVISS